MILDLLVLVRVDLHEQVRFPTAKESWKACVFVGNAFTSTLPSHRAHSRDFCVCCCCEVDHKDALYFCSVEQAVESDVMLYSHVHNLRVDLQLLPDQTDE